MAEKKLLTHLECDNTVRQYRGEIEKLQCQLRECPGAYEKAMGDRATAEELDKLEQHEVELERRLHNLQIAHYNAVGQMSDEWLPEMQRRDREAEDVMFAAELKFKEGEIRRAQEREAEQKAWKDAEHELNRVRRDNQAITSTMTEFRMEIFNKTKKRAADRREKRAAELATATA